jgi:aryl-alcohol dehydrogenase-like predicted oxidoreductase
VVGLGANNFGARLDLEQTRAVLDAALDAGINFIDTADLYGDGKSEEMIGAVLGGSRDDVIVATKFGMGRSGSLPGAPGTNAYVHAACEASLRRLRTETIDLFQYHKPNPDIPVEETLGALDELVKQGKIRYGGCSNFDAEQLLEAERVARAAGLAHFVSLQNEYSLLRREIEHDVIPACERLEVGVLPYFPLASGLLSGKYKRGAASPEGARLSGRDQLASDAEWDALEALERFASARGIELIDVAIGGLAAQPCVASVIAGATSPEQVHRNAAAGGWQPTTEDLEEIDRTVPSQRTFSPGPGRAS